MVPAGQSWPSPTKTVSAKRNLTGVPASKALETEDADDAIYEVGAGVEAAALWAVANPPFSRSAEQHITEIVKEAMRKETSA
jgi:hypothetical protein